MSLEKQCFVLTVLSEAIAIKAKKSSKTSVDVKLPAPSEIKSVSRLIIIIKTVMHERTCNCLRTNAKILSSSLLCEERASGKSCQIEIRRQTVKIWVKNKVNFVGDDLGNVIA